MIQLKKKEQLHDSANEIQLFIPFISFTRWTPKHCVMKKGELAATHRGDEYAKKFSKLLCSMTSSFSSSD